MSINWQVIHGNCIEIMRNMEENSIDAIITDPPYGLEFMGKEWDTFKKHGTWRPGKDESIRQFSKENYGTVNGGYAGYLNKAPNSYVAGTPFQEWCYEWGEEAIRVLKPGSFLLAFGGTRTYHRLTCGLEDAGFEIRDCLMWCYGSGFPKSMDISKQMDKILGVERKIICESPFKASKEAELRSKGKCQMGATVYAPITVPATPEAQPWSGFGTALKPAVEPIVMARKPISEKNIAANVLKWGTGGIHIDACRIPVDGTENRSRDNSKCKTQDKFFTGKRRIKQDIPMDLGRWPANLLLDEEAAKILDEQSGISKSTQRIGRRSGKEAGRLGEFKGQDNVCMGHNDMGGASRFFYVVKATTKERTMNGRVINNHPTVKPIKLMRYLCRLITPPGGTILDPFAGSGSTLVAAILEGFNVIGIEQDEENANIARQRCIITQQDLAAK